MTLILVLASNSLLLLLAIMMLLKLSKTLRGKRGALFVGLNLDDLLVLTLTSWVLSITSFMLPTWLMYPFALVIALYGILIWLDALLFIQYRIEINRQTLAWFLTGTKGISKGLPHLVVGLKKYPVAAIVPFAWLTLLMLQSSGLIYEWLTINAAPQVLWSGAWIMVSAIVLLATLLLMRLLFTSQHQFLTSPTLLLNVLADDSFEVADGIAIKPEHLKFVSPTPAKPKPSAQFGQLAGANIILLTVESLGAYIEPYVQQGARSRIAQRLQHSSWLSKQHFCLCPNTTVSTNQMYTGGYSNNPYNKKDSLFPGVEPQHINLLKQQGYTTLFLDSADIELYDYHKLLSRIGFDKVWGTADMPANGLKADYRLLNMVDEVAQQITGKPFFLHIINDQTHMPYEVVDKQRFNRHGFADNKSIYLNAMEEVDFILDSFLEKLGEKIDLSNTILVFTGDHGESFGEYGYSFHSNSVIKPQMQVPFMLTHPKLAAKTIEYSCHFDLFPTFFDLLGIDCPYATLGQSLAFDDREFAYFFHSATLKGNSPANFGFMLNGDMIWMDRLFNQVNILQQGQQKVSISAEQKRYSKTLLHRMLSHRGILV
jgi:hypothetical protein